MDKKIRSDLEELLKTWQSWLYTRNFYCAAMPKNILAQLMKEQNRRSGEPPNARNDALCAAWNMVMQNAHDVEPHMSIPFLWVYMKHYRPSPIKVLAADYGVNVDTIYWRAHSVAEKYYNKALELHKLNAQMQAEVAEDYD